jgi:hypothetical protein
MTACARTGGRYLHWKFFRVFFPTSFLSTVSVTTACARTGGRHFHWKLFRLLSFVSVEKIRLFKSVTPVRPGGTVQTLLYRILERFEPTSFVWIFKKYRVRAGGTGCQWSSRIPEIPFNSSIFPYY